MIREGTVLVVAAVLAVAAAGASNAQTQPMPASAQFGSSSLQGAAISGSELDLLRRSMGDELLVVGRIDAVRNDVLAVSVLGQEFAITPTDSALELLQRVEVGDAVALAGDLTPDGYFVSGGIVMPGMYVAGASKVYLRGIVEERQAAIARITVGSLDVDLSAALADSPPVGVGAEIIGVQPVINGVVLVDDLTVVSRTFEGRTSASLGTGRTAASLGTGRTAASLGTGRTAASLGTGRTAASLGTGRTAASLGTGRTAASLGTGRTAASLGTGRTAASLGTGRTAASLGTGRTAASLGTGRTAASLGTGRTAASLGTGRTAASLGTGRTAASLGTGRTAASLGTGRTAASLGTGHVN